MSNSIGDEDRFRMASLRKKPVQVYDLMVPGSGTPWEDAGSLGYFKAFFLTCFASLKSPIKLLWQVRRPETTSDASTFAMGCGICWGLSVIVHRVIWLYLFYNRDPHIEEIDVSQYWINSVLFAVGTIVGVWLLLKIVNRVYFKLTVLDSASKATPVVTYNMLAYSMGPSVLALIPFAPPLAVFWIFMLWIILGMTRLKIKPSGAIIASLLTLVSCVAICLAAFFVIDRFIWKFFFDLGSITLKQLPVKK